MKTASLKELKTEICTLFPTQLIDIVIQLAKYKKENKELLTYLLFDADDEQSYILSIKDYIDTQFVMVNKNSLYLAKKMSRKILKTTNKYIKFSGSKKTEIELLIFFCKKLKESGLPVHTNKALENIYQRQILKIKKTLLLLHEDLQFDYSEEIQLL